MSEVFDCCGAHLECQATGKCMREEAKDIDYKKCSIYNNVIKYKFPALYELKKKKIVEIESNHLTELGYKLLRNKMTDLNKVSILLTTIAVLSLHGNSRISPKVIYNTWAKLCKKLLNNE